MSPSQRGRSPKSKDRVIFGPGRGSPASKSAVPPVLGAEDAGAEERWSQRYVLASEDGGGRTPDAGAAASGGGKLVTTPLRGPSADQKLAKKKKNILLRSVDKSIEEFLSRQGRARGAHSAPPKSMSQFAQDHTPADKDIDLVQIESRLFEAGVDKPEELAIPDLRLRDLLSMLSPRNALKKESAMAGHRMWLVEEESRRVLDDQFAKEQEKLEREKMKVLGIKLTNPNPVHDGNTLHVYIKVLHSTSSLHSDSAFR